MFFIVFYVVFSDFDLQNRRPDALGDPRGPQGSPRGPRGGSRGVRRKLRKPLGLHFGTILAPFWVVFRVFFITEIH